MGLEQFKQFGKRKEKENETNNNVWIYTRVSSKDQEINKSLGNQTASGTKFASENGYIITNTFGGTYESASGDFTRKEFSKLILEVRAARKRPFAILIFTMSRFSRSGGKSLAVAYELIEELGVNLIEISTGKNTITKEGRLEIYELLIKASQENLDRLKLTMPGMRKYLEEGNWLGNAPKGYDQFGPRVKNHRFYNPTQKIIINKEGKILKQAWKWKVKGQPDYTIINKLKELNITISKSSLSDMWRKPFYCGVSCNKMLEGEVVNGNWEKMVSQNDFLYVQELLKGNRFGFKQDKANPFRPLNGFISCIICEDKMTGYEVKKKKIHYYKCQKCAGVSINANSTAKAKGIGAHQLFQSLLADYELPEKLIEPFKATLKLTYNNLNTDNEQEEVMLRKELEKQEAQLKKLIRKCMLEDDFDKVIFKELKTEFETTIGNLKSKLNHGSKKISNLDLYINKSVDVVKNINKYWASHDFETQKKIQELVFPDGILLDVKKRAYLTKKVNSVFSLTRDLSRSLEGKKKNGNRKNLLPSSSVAGTGLEPMTFGL